MNFFHHIFAGGDAVTGPRTVIEAIVAGKRAAVSIDCYLRGETIPDSPCVPEPRGEVDFLPVTYLEKVKLNRSQSLTLSVKERKGNFRQVDLGLTDEMALNEAKRCLRCDRCHGDGLCQFVCTELGINAIQLSLIKEEKSTLNKLISENRYGEVKDSIEIIEGLRELRVQKCK